MHTIGGKWTGARWHAKAEIFHIHDTPKKIMLIGWCVVEKRLATPGYDLLWLAKGKPSTSLLQPGEPFICFHELLNVPNSIAGL